MDEPLYLKHDSNVGAEVSSCERQIWILLVIKVARHCLGFTVGIL